MTLPKGIRENITPQEVVDFLNSLLQVDANAIHNLVEERVPCNEAMADHPLVQVVGGVSGMASVGFLGILNGMFGARPSDDPDYPGYGIIAADYDKFTLIGFKLLT